jgi:hypothetical protein
MDLPFTRVRANNTNHWPERWQSGLMRTPGERRTALSPHVDTPGIINTDGPDLHFRFVDVLPHFVPKRTHFWAYSIRSQYQIETSLILFNIMHSISGT